MARATSIWGPYEKMQSPLLTTGMVGVGGGAHGGKIVGPGHASFVQDATNPDVYYAVYAASVGNNCNRMAFIEEMRFNRDTAWPYINFPDAANVPKSASNATTAAAGKRPRS